jgi:hypothetical protein
MDMVARERNLVISASQMLTTWDRRFSLTNSLLLTHRQATYFQRKVAA